MKTSAAAVMANLSGAFRLGVSAVALAIGIGCSTTVNAAFRDPVVRATQAIACTPPVSRTLTPAEQRLEAHQRLERGLGTAYDRDPEIARRVAAAVNAEPKLAETSIWVEARRQFLTLRGCVRTPEQRTVAEGIARRTMGVLQVRSEMRVVPGSTSPEPVEPE